MKSIALAAMLLATSLMAHANAIESRDSCTIYGPNVCEEASQMEKSMSQTLPMDVSEMITMEKVAADRNELFILMRVHGEQARNLRKGIEGASDNGASLKTATQDSIFSSSCSGNKTHEFISNGGRVTYQFLYEDNVQMMQVSIMSCTQPLGEAA